MTPASEAPEERVRETGAPSFDFGFDAEEFSDRVLRLQFEDTGGHLQFLPSFSDYLPAYVSFFFLYFVWGTENFNNLTPHRSSWSNHVKIKDQSGLILAALKELVEGSEYRVPTFSSPMWQH